MIYVTTAAVAGLLAMLALGNMEARLTWYAIAGAPFFAGSAWFGARLFREINQQTSRRLALLLLLTIATVILLAA